MYKTAITRCNLADNLYRIDNNRTKNDKNIERIVNGTTYLYSHRLTFAPCDNLSISLTISSISSSSCSSSPINRHK